MKKHLLSNIIIFICSSCCFSQTTGINIVAQRISNNFVNVDSAKVHIKICIFNNDKIDYFIPFNDKNVSYYMGLFKDYSNNIKKEPYTSPLIIPYKLTGEIIPNRVIFISYPDTNLVNYDSKVELDKLIFGGVKIRSGEMVERVIEIQIPVFSNGIMHDYDFEDGELIQVKVGLILIKQKKIRQIKKRLKHKAGSYKLFQDVVLSNPVDVTFKRPK